MRQLSRSKAATKLFSPETLVRIGRIAALAVSVLAITPGAASACWVCMAGHGCRELGRGCGNYNHPLPAGMTCTDWYKVNRDSAGGNNPTSAPSTTDIKAEFLVDEKRNPNAGGKK